MTTNIDQEKLVININNLITSNKGSTNMKQKSVNDAENRNVYTNIADATRISLSVKCPNQMVLMLL